MPVYRITTRDGRQFDVTLREGVTPEQVLPELESMVASMPRAAEQERAPSTEDVNIFRDIPGAVISGVGSLVGLPAQAYGLATGDFDTFLGDISAGITKFGEEVKSPGLRERERLAGEKIEAAAGQGFGTEVGTALETYLSDPRLLLSGVAEAAPSLVGSLGAGTLAKVGVRGLARAAGKELAEKGLERAAVSGAVGFGAAQQGADVGAQTYISAMETPDEVWNRNPDYIDRISAGEDPNTVKQDMALSAARQAAGISGGISLATAGLMPGVEKVILGKGLTGGLLKRAGKGFLTEGGQETLEEGGGQFAENVGMRTVDPTRDLTQGVAGAGTVGGLLGGFMGAPVGALNRAPDEGMLPGGPGGAAVPPPPAAPVTPPGAELLGLLGQEGGTIRLREGDTEVPYVFRGIDDTGRILLEGGDGVLFAEDPADIADILMPPAAAPGAPPAPPAPPVPPAPPPVATPPSPPVVPTPPVAPPPAPTPPPVAPTPPAGIPTPPPPVQPGVPGPQPGAPPVPTPPPGAPLGKPVIQNEETRNFWRSSLARQRSELTKRRDDLNFELTNLQQSAGSLPQAEFEAKRDDLIDSIDRISGELTSVDEDIQGIEQGVAPVPRARPLDDITATVADTPDTALTEAVRSLPAAGVMDWFAENASTDFHRAVAKRIGNLLKAMEQSGFEFNWGVYDKNYKPKDEAERANYLSVMNSPKTKGAAWTQSQYGAQTYKDAGYRNLDKGFDRVDLGVKAPGLPNSGANEVTILHEFAHAVTVAAIQQLRDKNISPNSRVGQAVKELRDLKKAAVTHKNQLLKDIASGKPVDPRLRQALERLENSNAWANEKELIVQGLSNIDMQIVLKSMPYKKTNGFMEFIREIGRLIGMTEKDMNGLRRLFELTDELIPTDAAAQQDIIQAMQKPDEYNAAQAPAPAPTPTPPAPTPPTGTVPQKKYTFQPPINSGAPADLGKDAIDPGYYRPGALIIDETFFQYGVGKDYLDAQNLDALIDQLLDAGAEINIKDQDGLFWDKNEGVDKIVGPGFRGANGGLYSKYFFRAMKAGSLAHPRLEVVIKQPVEVTLPGGGKPKSATTPAQAKPEKVTSGTQESELPFTPSDTGEGANLPKLDFSKKGLLGTYKRDVEMVPISWLQSLPGNELRRTPEQMDELQQDIEENGINDPVIINVGRNTQTAELGEGNHRLEVARRLGYTHLPARVSVGREYGSDKPGSQRDDLIPEAGKYFPADVKPSAAFRSLQGAAAEPSAGPTAPTASEILTPEEEALRITSEAATEPAADSMETIKEAAQPSIRLYNIRSELQEKNRGCD